MKVLYYLHPYKLLLITSLHHKKKIVIYLQSWSRQGLITFRNQLVISPDSSKIYPVGDESGRKD